MSDMEMVRQKLTSYDLNLSSVMKQAKILNCFLFLFTRELCHELHIELPYCDEIKQTRYYLQCFIRSVPGEGDVTFRSTPNPFHLALGGDKVINPYIPTQTPEED